MKDVETCVTEIDDGGLIIVVGFGDECEGMLKYRYTFRFRLVWGTNRDTWMPDLRSAKRRENEGYEMFRTLWTKANPRDSLVKKSDLPQIKEMTKVAKNYGMAIVEEYESYDGPSDTNKALRLSMEAARARASLREKELLFARWRSANCGDDLAAEWKYELALLGKLYYEADQEYERVERFVRTISDFVGKAARRKMHPQN